MARRPGYTGANGGKATMLISADGAGACTVANPATQPYGSMERRWNLYEHRFPRWRALYLRFHQRRRHKECDLSTHRSATGAAAEICMPNRLYDDVPATGYAPVGWP